MTILSIDFETASKCDLKVAGLANYAADPSTIVHCMAYAFDDEPVEIFPAFTPPKDGSVWASIISVCNHVQDGGLVYAHNAAFELAIWNNVMVPRYGWPILKPEQVRCTMAMAYAMALPGALEDVAPALGIAQRKDGKGKSVMLQLCRPRLDGRLWKPEDDPAKFQILYDYCKQDVEVERAIHARLMELSPQEQALWVLDYKINQRGVLVDLPAIKAGLKLVGRESERLNDEMLRVTGGVVRKCSEVALLTKWIASRGVTLPKVDDRTTLAKAALLDALAGDLPDDVRQALELRKAFAKTSTAKLLAMQERASKDGRVRGIHQYHGASTGRWAGRGIQPQNLPRPRPGIKPKDVQSMIGLFTKPEQLDMVYGPILDALADCVRGMIIAPPGKDLVAVDFSAVEARVLAWLAGQEDLLQVFREGGDVYKVAASGIYRVPVTEVTKDQRQVGKVAVLALGYGGGRGAFQSMAANYGVKVSDSEAEDIKAAWRSSHDAIVNYWWALEHGAKQALAQKDPVKVGPPGRQVAFLKRGSFVWCRLPSGRTICYPYPELRTITNVTHGKEWEAEAFTYMTVVSNLKAKVLEDPAANSKWKRVATYGGSLAENITQAVARDLLAEAMVRLERDGNHIVMHCHDEAVLEIESVREDGALARIEALMAEVPAWATGLPLAAEGWRGPRYRKG